MKLIYEAVRGRRFALACVLAIVASAIVAPSASPRPQAHASDTLLQTINMPLDGSKVYSPVLVAGAVYRIVASGTYTQNGGGGTPAERDALYCFRHDSPYATFSCSPPNPPQRQHLTIVRYEGDTSLTHDLDNLDPATTLAYNPLHTYQETFTAPTASRLEVFLGGDPSAYTYSGGIRLDLYLVSLPPRPGGSQPPGPGPPKTRVSRVLDPVTAWGQSGAAIPIAPGDEVVAPSPRFEPKQREATVTVSGDPTGKTAVAAELTALDCVRLFIVHHFALPVSDRSRRGGFHYAQKLEDDDKEFALSLFAMFACLEEIRAANSAKAPGAQRAAAARSRCGRSAARVQVDVNRASNTVRWEVRHSRRGPRPLRISCRLARNGAVTMRIRTTSRHTTLRKLVGVRLVIGLYRAREARGTANILTTFKRR